MGKPYEIEEKALLRDNASTHTEKQLQEMLLKIGSNRSISSISNMKHKLGVKCSFNAGQYKKGNVPLNKGTKGMFNVGGNRTSFKKGNIPLNYRPVGSERVNVDGYIEIKIKDPNKWELKHRVVYESVYGKIPKGSNITFIDGNRLNLDIENLSLITQAENLILNQHELRADDTEITKSAIALAKLIDKTQKLKKGE